MGAIAIGEKPAAEVDCCMGCIVEFDPVLTPIILAASVHDLIDEHGGNERLGYGVGKKRRFK